MGFYLDALKDVPGAIANWRNGGYKSNKARLQAAVLDLKQEDEYEARQVVVMPNHYYGLTGTIHGSETIDIQISGGKVTEVWFRCQQLPFTVYEIRPDGNLNSVRLPEDNDPDWPHIVGIELRRAQ